MSSAAGQGAAAGRSGWPLALVVLALALACLGVAFAEEGAAAVGVWNSSTAYNHCWLVAPIAAWLAWMRRDRLAGLRPEPNWLAALGTLPLSLGWLAAERLGIMEGRQLAAVSIMLAVTLAILGWRFGRAMAAPLLYLFFLVPVGEFLTPRLQEITTRFVDLGLDVVGIPHYIDGFVIQTPNATFLVAEACAGLRFLIAAVAFGTLYALVMFRSPGRRAIVLALSVAVPIVANGFRALGLVLIGHYHGDAQAALADHVTYGWVFFSVVMLLLILAGLPFREDTPAGEQGQVRRPPGDAWAGPPPGAAAAVATVLALAGPGAAMVLAAESAGGPRATAMALQPVPGCVQAPDGLGLDCGEARVSAQFVVFPDRVTWAAVSAERHRAMAATDTDQGWRAIASGGRAIWDIVKRGDEAVAVAMFLSGGPAGSGLNGRVQQGWNSVGWGAGRPVMAVVTMNGRAMPRREIDMVLGAQNSLVAAGATLSR